MKVIVTHSECALPLHKNENYSPGNRRSPRGKGRFRGDCLHLVHWTGASLARHEGHEQVSPEEENEMRSREVKAHGRERTSGENTGRHGDGPG